eukprot:4310668-Pyramimonas_sp.AAC.1
MCGDPSRCQERVKSVSSLFTSSVEITETLHTQGGGMFAWGLFASDTCVGGVGCCLKVLLQGVLTAPIMLSSC